MKPLIEQFASHVQDSMALGHALTWKSSFKPKHIVISGLGGSGIGGTIVASLLYKSAQVPIVVNKGYHIPSFVDENTLFLASSYSGNTEETLMALDEAQKKGAHIACLSSGGKLIDLAQKNSWNYAKMPGGFPPRAAFGYSSTQLFYILEKYGVVKSSDFEDAFKRVISLLSESEESVQKLAYNIAQKIYQKYTVIYTEDTYEGVAVRFRQQINENGKNLCWHHVIPEMNHNELVGWTEKHPHLIPIFFRTEDEFVRNTARIEINKGIISKYVSEIIEIKALGKNPIERTYYLVHLTDWISYYISELKNIDVTEVKVIDFLKAELSKV